MLEPYDFIGHVWLLTTRRWTDSLPINVYVIDHEDGLILFDTGQDRTAVTDPAYYPGGSLVSSTEELVGSTSSPTKRWMRGWPRLATT